MDFIHALLGQLPGAFLSFLTLGAVSILVLVRGKGLGIAKPLALSGLALLLFVAVVAQVVSTILITQQVELGFQRMNTGLWT